MNIKRVIFWFGFIVVLGLIVWGLIVSMDKQSAGLRVKDPAPISSTDHIRGAENASTTIVEYSDFQCPACQNYYPVVEHLFASSTIPLRIVYRNFPLPQHKNAMAAAEAAEAAAMQGKFWEMYSLIFANHIEWTELSDPR
jgi:protein-disulfide isomerase